MLTDDERKHYAQALQDKQAAIEAKLAANEGSSATVSLDSAIGRLTRMDALQQQQMALHARRRLELQLARVRGALIRIDEGSFGACALCKETVPHERLELAPEMPFCIECQRRLEREGRI